MPFLTQKKISIDSEQKHFLENYRQWGFPDQSSIVREALDKLIKELKKKQKKQQMSEKAAELVSEYASDKELTGFTDLDGEDFLPFKYAQSPQHVLYKRLEWFLSPSWKR